MALVVACRKAAGPLGDQAASSFEAVLTDYVRALRLPLQAAKQALAILAQHDFSSARAHLIASVPGYHTGRSEILYACKSFTDVQKVRALGGLSLFLELLEALKHTREWYETSYGAATVACNILCKLKVLTESTPACICRCQHEKVWSHAGA